MKDQEKKIDELQKEVEVANLRREEHEHNFHSATQYNQEEYDYAVKQENQRSNQLDNHSATREN